MMVVHSQNYPHAEQREKQRKFAGEPLAFDEIKKRLAVQVVRCPRPHARYDQPLSPAHWLDPKQRSEWHKSLQWVVEAQRATLQGHVDVHGNHWCWRCYHRACLVDLGARLNYPHIARSLLGFLDQYWFQEVCPQAEEATQSGIGFDFWMVVAIHGPYQVVADTLSMFRRAAPASSFSADKQSE